MRTSRVLQLSLCALGLALGACASGAKMQAMVPQGLGLEDGHRHPHTVKLSGAGGRETQWWSKSEISDANFSAALHEALRQSGIFSAVVHDSDADYLLDVFITAVRQPIFGFSMTVIVVANWTLTDLATNRVVFQEMIPASHEATVGDAFVGLERLRLANEGAARANIAEGIRRLSRLQLAAESGAPATATPAPTASVPS